MDMELRRVTLEGYRSVAHAMFSQEETLESIVPDACPDIARIVSASGKVFLKDKELGEGTLRLNGTAKVTVLYIPEGRRFPGRWRCPFRSSASGTIRNSMPDVR